MVLFNWGWSRLINKLSLIRSLNLFASEARISKWSKPVEQLYSSRWSDTTDCLTHLRCFLVKSEILMCSEKNLICVLPFLGKRSMELRTNLVNSIESSLKFCKLKVIFQSPCKLNLLFCYKDTLQKKIRSDIVYRNMCSNCNVIYYGKTYCHFFTRAAEHIISNLIYF